MAIDFRFRWISLFFILLICPFITAQKRIKIHSIGTSISTNQTPNEAIEQAILDAKKNAMLKAGVTEKLMVSSLLHQTSNNDATENYFNEISTIESNASIVVDSVTSINKTFDQYSNMIVTVELDATVFKYKYERDPTFFFKVEGLKDVFYENELIDFSFIPSQNGYLIVFVFNQNETFVLYPFENLEHEYLNDQKERVFEKDIKVSFPIHDAYRPGYPIELESEGEDETSSLLFVFTKKHIPWIESGISRKSVLYWIYQIPLNQREVLIKSILLKQNQ